METVQKEYVSDEQIIQQRLLYKSAVWKSIHHSISDFHGSIYNKHALSESQKSSGNDNIENEIDNKKHSVEKLNSNIDSTFNELLEQFDNLEFQITKAELASTNNMRDIEYYSQKTKDRENQIKKIKSEIEQLSDELSVNEAVKKLKSKYEVTSKVISTYEEEQTIRNKTNEHKLRLEKLEADYKFSTKMIDLRRKQLEVALVTLNDFQKSIEEGN